MCTSEIWRTPAVPANPNANPAVPAAAEIQRTFEIFQVSNAKLYFPVVSLFFNDNIKFLENIKQGFKKTIFWTNIDLK